MALRQGKKTMRIAKFHGGNVPYCWPFSGADAHPPHAINQTNISAHSCNTSEQS